MLALLAALALLQPAPEPPAPPPPSSATAPRPPAPPRPPRPPRPAGGEEGPRVVTSRVLVAVPGGEVEPLRGEWPAEPSGKRVSMDSNDSIDDVLQEIAQAAGWNVVLNTGRVGERLLVMKLADVPVEEALRAALTGTGLAATRHGQVVVVAPAVGPVAERPVLSGFERPTGKRFSGEFQDLDGRDALLQMGKATGLSLVLPPGPLGKVTAHFKDVPVEEALRAVLAQLGLQAVREGALVTVTPRPGRFEFRGELGPELGRTVEEAVRQAEREVKQAERELRRAGGGAGRDRQQVGGDVVIEAGEEARDVVAVKGDVTLKAGAEARDVVAVLGSVTLEAGASAREAVAVGGDVRVGPGASVEKDAVSVGGRVQVDPTGDVGGERTAVPFPRVAEVLGVARERADEPRSALWEVAGVLARYAVYLALGLLLLALVPRRLEAVAAAMVADPIRSLLAGLLGLLAQPFLLVLLVVTIIGIPLVAVQALGVLAAGVMGFTALAWHLGRSLPSGVQRGATVLQLALGTAILVAITAIPYLGWLVWAAVTMFTFGAVLRTRFGQPAVLPTVAVPPPMPPAAPPAS